MVEIIIYSVGLSLFIWRLRQRTLKNFESSTSTEQSGTLGRQLEAQQGIQPATLLMETQQNHQFTLLNLQNPLKDLAILIPARNEALTLPKILKSLKPAQSAGAQIVVIDDQSTDGTDEVAKRFQVRVCSTKPKPEGWSGKNWACHSGYEFLQKNSINTKYILFTDADTEHHPDKLQKAVLWAEQHQTDLLTARPYHLSPSFWETLLGPFYLMIAFITNAKEPKPRSDRFFAIGQFLLFRSEWYRQMGGHTAVKAELAEDLALARLCFNSHKRFFVYPSTALYGTRMYPTMTDFYQGWSRNFCLGMQNSNWPTWIEILLIFGTLLRPPHVELYLLNALIILVLQRKEGRFHWVGAALYPLSLLGIIVISLNSAIMRLRKKPIFWKSREYAQ